MSDSADRKYSDFVEANLTAVPPEGCDLKVGDTVSWVNDYGVAWTHKVIGFNTTRWYNAEYSKFVHLNSDAYWFPHDHKTLTKVAENS